VHIEQPPIDEVKQISLISDELDRETDIARRDLDDLKESREQLSMGNLIHLRPLRVSD
jgi:hypothetical protein